MVPITILNLLFTSVIIISAILLKKLNYVKASFIEQILTISFVSFVLFPIFVIYFTDKKALFMPLVRFYSYLTKEKVDNTNDTIYMTNNKLFVDVLINNKKHTLNIPYHTIEYHEIKDETKEKYNITSIDGTKIKGGDIRHTYLIIPETDLTFHLKLENDCGDTVEKQFDENERVHFKWLN